MAWYTHPAVLIAATFTGTIIVFLAATVLPKLSKRMKEKRIAKQLEATKKALLLQKKADKKVTVPLATITKEQHPFLIFIAEKLYREDQLKNVTFYEEVKFSDVIKRKPKFFRIPFTKRKIEIADVPIKNKVLIRMEMNTGVHTEFFVKENKSGFKRKGKKYLFDLPVRFYLESSRTYAYDFHESFTLPFKREFPVDEIKEGIESSKISEVEYAVNPTTLERFVNAEIAQGIMQGAALGKVFKILMVIAAIGLTIGIVDLMTDIYSTGVFDNVFKK